jgi:GMP reductase
MTDLKFDYDDILLFPEVSSDIESRSEVTPNYVVQVADFQNYFLPGNTDVLLTKDTVALPIISSPMFGVLNTAEKVSKRFNPHFNTEMKRYGITVAQPRGNNYPQSGEFESYSLKDFNEFYLPKVRTIQKHFTNNPFKPKILIDIANGHMKSLEDSIKAAKEEFPEMIIMAGNVANPKTYKNLSLAGADFIRIGIGNGAGCLTTQQTAIGYPMASLIEECYEEAKLLPPNRRAKIVADGGTKKYSDIIKALSLGADYIMLGSILNKALESDATPYLWKLIPIKNRKVAKWLFNLRLPRNTKLPLYKKFSGMSTKEVQKKWGNTILKTSEGVTRWNRVEYTLEGWITNFKDYLKSNMSYSNCRTLEDFVGSNNHIKITNAARDRFKK